MPEREGHSIVRSADDPTDVLSRLTAEWRDELQRSKSAFEEADDPVEKQRHAGRVRALEFALGWIESGLSGDTALDVLKRLPNRLAERSQDTIEHHGAGRMVGTKFTAMGEQLDEMVALTREIRYDALEEWGEPPDPDDWEWVNEEVKERLLGHWGHDTDE